MLCASKRHAFTTGVLELVHSMLQGMRTWMRSESDSSFYFSGRLYIDKVCMRRSGKR